MLNSFLEVSLSDSNTLIAIATFIIGIPTAIGLIVTIRQNRDTKYLQFIKDVDDEFACQIKEEPILSDMDSCIIYAYNYVDICDRVMFLMKKGIISNDFFEYYRDFFNYAITVMWWYTVNYPQDDHSLKFSWNTLTNWIINMAKESDAYPVMHLPKKMQELLPKDKKIIDKVEICKDLRKQLKSIKVQNTG